jgi:hypothetical protein|tara:strand:+ start:373 stop:564 length:192 start_codon:yes stop_codon:yes gene_type:complete
MAKYRKVIKDKMSGIPKKYLSGTEGSRRRRLSNVLQRISRLYKAGKRIPQSLIDERIKLGRKK